jgi:uncharacterized sporulation protein YeaH/YhbH (DUF444 family)
MDNGVRINSDESEGIFNDFITDVLEDKVEDILNDGEFEKNASGDVIVEADDIQPPTFTFGDNNGGEGGGKGNQPGEGGEKLKFSFPFERFMEIVAGKLSLPDLCKEGDGRIKEMTTVFKTFGQSGIVLNKKRTFKQAIKSSIGTGLYNPDEDKYDVLIKKKDKRYHLPEYVEKPKFKAVVFYMGDISYSQYGERLKLQKKVVNFIQNWIDYSYGKENVDHRFFVHDWEAYEVQPEDFYKADVAGGTRASVAFELVNTIARDEYDTESTNYYGFYFGDGELFGDDAQKISEIVTNDYVPIFNSVGVVEIKPSMISNLKNTLDASVNSSVLKTAVLKNNKDVVSVIKELFKKTRKRILSDSY